MPTSVRLHYQRLPEWDFCINADLIPSCSWSHLDELFEKDECLGCMQLPIEGIWSNKWIWCELSLKLAELQREGLCIVVPTSAPNPFIEDGIGIDTDED
jgi:hypothetical protein